MTRVLFNATAHPQGEHADRYRELGWSVEVEPRLRRCGPDVAHLEAEAERVAAGVEDGADVLVGGLGYLCDALALRLLPRGCRLWTALTSRIGDDQGRFVFTGPLEVVETPLSRWWRERHSK